MRGRAACAVVADLQHGASSARSTVGADTRQPDRPSRSLLAASPTTRATGRSAPPRAAPPAIPSPRRARGASREQSTIGACRSSAASSADDRVVGERGDGERRAHGRERRRTSTRTRHDAPGRSRAPPWRTRSSRAVLRQRVLQRSPPPRREHRPHEVAAAGDDRRREQEPVDRQDAAVARPSEKNCRTAAAASSSATRSTSRRRTLALLPGSPSTAGDGASTSTSVSREKSAAGARGSPGTGSRRGDATRRGRSGRRADRCRRSRPTRRGRPPATSRSSGCC